MEDGIATLPTTTTVTKTAKFSILTPSTTVFQGPSRKTGNEETEQTSRNNVQQSVEESETLAQEQFKLLYSKYPTSNVAFVSLQERKLLGPNYFGRPNNEKKLAVDKSKVISTMYDEIKLTQDIEYLSKATSTVSLTYGEINDVDSMINTFRLLKEHDAFPIPNTQGRDIVFYDLGSGTGRVVMAIALLGYATHCIGIEIQSSLYQTSKLVQQSYETLLQTHSFYTPLPTPPTIEFHHGSIIDPIHTVQWKEADIVFINCTCFDNDLMDQLYLVIKTMRRDSLIILLSITLPKEVECEFLCEFRQQMSW
jgi:hypothetical protein